MRVLSANATADDGDDATDDDGDDDSDLADAQVKDKFGETPLNRIDQFVRDIK